MTLLELARKFAMLGLVRCLLSDAHFTITGRGGLRLWTRGFSNRDNIEHFQTAGTSLRLLSYNYVCVRTAAKLKLIAPQDEHRNLKERVLELELEVSKSELC